jgi:spore germination protein
MFFFNWFKRPRKALITGSSQTIPPNLMVEYDLTSRLNWFHQQLNNCSDIKYHELQLPGDISCAFIYITGMVDQKLLQEQIINPLLFNVTGTSGSDLVHKIADLKQLPVSHMETGFDLQQALSSLFDGKIVLLVDNEPKILIFPMRSVEKRAIETTKNENVIRGPQEAFVEDLSTNITMIRRRIKHPALKMEPLKLGTYTNTNIMLCYVEGICQKKLVDEVRREFPELI